jgi:hypothetical protein
MLQSKSSAAGALAVLLVRVLVVSVAVSTPVDTLPFNDCSSVKFSFLLCGAANLNKNF